MGTIIDLLPLLGELKEILTGVLGGDFDVLSTEGSLAGDGSAAEAGGSIVGSVIGSLGGEDLVDLIPGTIPEALGSVANAG
ncbi:MAG: hypothetical protein ACI38U_11085 [Corynebacterium sp.]|jgi:hypothetical protein|uniref:hypothetical protein n=1 Tax=unclassified Corynebacterium TaxID=2624378 RepID=UPI000964C769|nr:hypothetical protein [Corynebacterium sp. CNJ-954]OLT51167.1 hypothetical protein BJF89_08620 [Corynebacterium sp. CNJ-954]